MDLDMGGLAEFASSSDGLFTLTAANIGKYTITVSLKNTATATNILWATPNEDGEVTDDMTFEFEIGPERITVESYIIGYDKGVYEKRVTYNGAEQTLSIMHVSRDKMDVDSGGLRDNVADNVLTVWALNAGTYTITLTPKSIYCWADGSSDPLEFTFIIDKQKITAPYLVDSGDNVKDNVKPSRTAEKPTTTARSGTKP